MPPTTLQLSPARSRSARPTTEKPWSEFCLKLQFQSKRTISDTDVAHYAIQVLSAVKDSFGSKVTIKNNANRELRINSISQCDDFATLYTLYATYHYPGTKTRGTKNRAWIIFRMKTPLTLSTIREDPLVAL